MGNTQDKNKSGKMAYIFLAITIIPLFFFGILISVLATELFTKTMYQEVESELCGAAKTVSYLIDIAYPGDYRLVGEASYRIYKGEHDLTQEYALVDNIKESTGFDITLFYQDTRILTTILDKDGKRIVGSGAPQIVLRDVLEHETPHFYTNTHINSEEYFSYYAPLKNSDGSTIGMIFIGKPSTQVDASIQEAISPLLLAVAGVALLISFCIYLYTREFDLVLQKIREFLSAISSEALNAELDREVLKRKDEFGDIGRSAIHMQQALRHLIEQDALTELYNRRCGGRRLRQIIEKSKEKEMPFSVCIGDIDFFKKVNDTYGHDCGDIVLKHVAGILRDHMNSVGFVARWGGEEFLLVFDHMDTDASYQSLEELLDKIRAAEIPYGDLIIHVTMTFGLTAGDTDDFSTLLKNADENLYNGKTGGRNRVVR